MTTTYTIECGWILNSNAQPRPQGQLTLRDGRVIACGNDLTTPTHRWNNRTLLIPALINSHTHLEFSSLPRPLGNSGDDFVEWISEVIRWRQSVSDSERCAAIQMGLIESARAGVGVVAEIATRPWTQDFNQSALVEVRSYFEQLGFAPGQAAEREMSLNEALQNAGPSGASAGISPHAPYSVGRDLWHRLLDLARRDDRPLAMHLAESLAEREFCTSGSGPFRELLERLQLWSPESKPLTIAECLAGLAQSQQPGLIVHGNYLLDDEIQMLAQHPHLSVVYCPRTHFYFRHRTYPLLSLRRAGVRVVIGTDSRASNPDLDVLSELRWVWHQFPELSPLEVLQMGTEQGAQALGISERWGSFSPGKLARGVILEFARPIEDPWQALFEWPVVARYPMLADVPPDVVEST